MSVKVDDSAFQKAMTELGKMTSTVMRKGGVEFKRLTPKAPAPHGGNAKRSTYTRGKTIIADYGYAGRLDSGTWSKQAPKGMSDPTIDFIDNEIDRQLRKIF